MPVLVKLSTSLRAYVPGYDAKVGLYITPPLGITVAALAESLHLPLEEITVIMVNGVRASESDIVQPDDRVAFFPAVGGG